MIAEALEKLRSWTTDSLRAELVRLDGDAPGRHLLVASDGTYDELHTDPHPRELRTDSVDEVARVAVEHFDQEVTAEKRMLICYGPGFAELIFDYRHSVERLVCRIDPTWEHRFFEGIAARPAGRLFEVDDAVDLFDLPLRATMPEPGFLASIGKLKRVTEEERQSEKDSTSSLVGGLTKRQISLNGLPDAGVHLFRVRPWQSDEFPRRVDLPVLVRADLNTMQWRFFIVPDGMVAYEDASVRMIGDRLSKMVGGSQIPIVQAQFFQGEQFGLRRGIDEGQDAFSGSVDDD